MTYDILLNQEQITLHAGYIGGLSGAGHFLTLLMFPAELETEPDSQEPERTPCIRGWERAEAPTWGLSPCARPSSRVDAKELPQGDNLPVPKLGQSE